jgi:hypothetical protein
MEKLLMANQTAVPAFLFAFILACSSVQAGEGYYECKILNIYELNEGGALLEETVSEDSRIRVSRVDGQVAGESLPTDTASKTEVISPGDERNSFRAVAHFQAGRAGHHVQVIYIEVAPKKQKPFVAFSMGGPGIVTGTCELASSH